MNNSKTLLLCLALFIGMQQETIAYARSRSSSIKAIATFYVDQVNTNNYDHDHAEHDACNHNHHESSNDSSDDDIEDNGSHDGGCDCGCSDNGETTED